MALAWSEEAFGEVVTSPWRKDGTTQGPCQPWGLAGTGHRWLLQLILALEANWGSCLS